MSTFEQRESMIGKKMKEMVDNKLASEWLPNLRNFPESKRKKVLLEISKYFQNRIMLAIKKGQRDFHADVGLSQIKRYFPQYQKLIDNPVSVIAQELGNITPSTQKQYNYSHEKKFNPREKNSLLKLIALIVPMLASQNRFQYIRPDGKVNITQLADWLAEKWEKNNPQDLENMSSSNIEKKIREALKLLD
jgi:hypothetical protein